jgi:hypothetical protein
MFKLLFVFLLSLVLSIQAVVAERIKPSDEKNALNENALKIIEIINHPDIAVGIELEPYTDVSVKPDRIKEVTSLVRDGNKALRLEIKPGDCGTPWPIQVGGWDDCGKGNERIGVNEESKRLGEWFYTVSLFLDQETFSKIPLRQTHMNLMQWLDQKSEYGPVFNLMWFWGNPTVNYLNVPSVMIPPMSLVIDNRLSKFKENEPNGYNAWPPMKVVGTDAGNNNITGKWLDFTVYANWSKDASGWFIVGLNNELILDYRGATIEPRSNGLVFDVQLYRYGSMEARNENKNGIVRGNTNNVLFADNIGVFASLDKLKNDRERFAGMAKRLVKALVTPREDSAKFQPPYKTNYYSYYENLNLRYEDCSASPFCDF